MKTVEPLSDARTPMLRVKLSHPGVGGFEAVIEDRRPRPVVAPSLKLDLPKLKWNDRRGGYLQIWNYFDAVYTRQQSEAFVWLHWRAATDGRPGEYVAVVPAFYCATQGGLTYPAAPARFCDVCQVAMFDAADFCPHCGPEVGRPTDACFLGDIHSHGAMSPFHSATDDHDETDHTGFHLTFGHLQDGPTRVAHSFVVADGPTRFETEWRDHFEFEESDFDRDRLQLWLSLIDRQGAPAAVVPVGSEQPVYLGVQRECELWLAGRRDRDRFAVVPRARSARPAPPSGGYAPPLSVVARPKNAAPSRKNFTDWSFGRDDETTDDRVRDLIDEALNALDASSELESWFRCRVALADLGDLAFEAWLDEHCGTVPPGIAAHIEDEGDGWNGRFSDACTALALRLGEPEARHRIREAILEAVANFSGLSAELVDEMRRREIELTLGK